MAKKGDRIQVKFRKPTSLLDFLMKNKKNDIERLELKKYDPELFANILAIQ